jgi:flagellar hook-associated protein 1 FlgK
MSTLSIAVSGLNAATVGLTTTSHNIANQSTPGYNRQVTVQASNFPVLTGAGFIGQGTNVETVKRVYDQFLSRQVLSAQTGSAEMDSYYQQINQINSVLADTTSGLSSALSGFFGGVQTVAANPSSISARQSMLSSAQTLVSRFQSLNQRMTEIRDGVNSQITAETASVSTYASQIADLNQRIITAQAGSQTQQPNDLLDKRDQLIADLNKIVRVSTVNQSDGTVSVFFGNGQPLVVGADNYTLSAVAAPDDPERMVVVMKTPGGTTLQIPESQITGGTLGGLISFRSESLDSAQNALGRAAIALTQTFNAQHQLGQDLTGALGGDFFSVSAPTAYANALNGGSGVLTASFSGTAASDLTTSDYRLTYTGVGANPYSLTRLSDNQTWTGATAAAVATASGQGFSLSLAGTPNAGDSFKIEPTRSGASSIGLVVTDARNIAAAMPMSTAARLTNTGTGKVSAGSVAATPTTPNPTHPTTDLHLQDSVTITFTSPTTYVAVDTTTATTLTPVGGATYTPGANISYNGWTLQISGAPATNDVFTVGANASGVSDNRNAMALAALQTANTMIGGTASYQSAYSQLVSEVGTKTAQVKSLGDAQQALADSAVSTQQSMSGVNLDEEAANLIKYQQAYQASAKVIDIASKLFDQILALG